MAVEAFPRNGSAFRVVLEPRMEGVYVFVYLTRESAAPEVDMLQDDLDMAKRACSDDYGIFAEDWREMPDPERHQGRPGEGGQPHVPG